MRHALLVIVLLVCAVIIASALASSAVDSFQASCEAGEADPGLCRVAEIGGLFDGDEPTPAPAAEGDVQ
jgi:hypothetical protein